MALYDRPVWQLLKEAIAELGDPISTDQVLAWFEEHYPRVNERTIRQHLRAFSANDGTKRYMPSLPKDVLFKTGRKAYTLYDPDRHGLFDEFGKTVSEYQDETELAEDDLLESEADLGFSLERYLEEFIEENWDRIDFGRPLQLYSGTEGQTGRQYQTGVGIIDFLCEDTSKGDLVVIELKKGRSSDSVLGQCQRYMGWIKQHIARPGQDVCGLIITAEQDEKLKYALLAAPTLAMRCFQVSFRLFNPDEGTRET